MNMPLILFQENLYQSISVHGVILVNRPEVIKHFSTHIARSLTRLKSVFITLGNVESSKLKEVNICFHPIGASTNDGYAIDDEHQFWIQIGSKLIPEYPIPSVTEALYQLKKAVGNPFQMYARWYRTHKYIRN